MKSILIKVTLERRKSRAHGVLFDSNLPFRARKEVRRDVYSRRQKHQSRLIDG